MAPNCFADQIVREVNPLSRLTRNGCQSRYWWLLPPRVDRNDASQRSAERLLLDKLRRIGDHKVYRSTIHRLPHLPHPVVEYETAHRGFVWIQTRFPAAASDCVETSPRIAKTPMFHALRP